MRYFQKPSNGMIEAGPGFPPGLSRQNRLLYVNLWRELKRRRAALLQSMGLDDLREMSEGLFSDVADQASVDREQELTLLAKARLREQLREIEHALAAMQRHAYGLCMHCGKAIPFARLKVQPCARSCVSCQSMGERKLVTFAHARQEPVHLSEET